MKTNYWIDNYCSGSPRDLRGPYPSLREARRRTEGVKVSVAPYDGVVEQLGGSAELVEAWAKTEDSEDYQAIYKA